MSLIETHIGFLEFAQKEYQNALSVQSGQGVSYWLDQMHCLCQQLYWLQHSCGNPVAIGVAPEGYDIESIKALLQKPGAVSIQAPNRKPTPTEYAWNDGFEGVILDNDK